MPGLPAPRFDGPWPDGETQRLELVHTLQLCGEPPDPSLHALVRAAQHLTGCAAALLTLIERDKVWPVASIGAARCSAPRAQAFCTHAVLHAGFFECTDLLGDARFAGFDGVSHEGGWRRYAAVPLVVDGHAVGTLCVLDVAPGALSEAARGHLESLAVVARDLLDQRRQRLALEKRAERWQDLARASGDWAWELDETLRYRWIAGEFQATTGREAAEVIGQEMADEPLVDASGQRLHPPRGLLDVLADRRAFSRVLSLQAGPRGRLIISRSAMPVVGPGGEFKGFRGSARDLTARLERDALLHDKAAAEAASRAKSEFLSRVSHELRTPLNAVLGFSHLMAIDQEEPLGPQQAHRVEGVQRAGRRLLEMINEVLDISRIEQGELRLDLRPLALTDAVDASVAAVRPLAEMLPVALQSAVRPGIVVRADARVLEQILVNLLSNAIQFNRPGGRVDVGAVAAAGRVVISVSDTGPGLEPAELARLFQPFDRLGAERRRAAGSGLGLVIVRELARTLGGEVRVESVPGEGSTFSVDLPAAAGAAAPVPVLRPSGSAVPRSAVPRRVLYIEDETLNVILMQEVFKAQPAWTLDVARDGHEGVALALDTQPDLALIDMNLPDIDGREVLRRLRAHPATQGLHCIALSADAMDEQIASALAAGFDDYWTKPIDLRQFLSRIGRVFDALGARR